MWTTYMDVSFNEMFETSDFQQLSLNSIYIQYSSS